MAKNSKRPNVYETLRTDILSTFLEIFKTHLKTPKSQPLHEIIFFDDVQAVKRHIVGMPRAAITMGLSNPHHYLQVCCLILATCSFIFYIFI